MTAPGLGHDEGVFLVTAADDGSRAIYFIAKNMRHSISVADLQLEQQLNPLWPVRYSSREDVLAFAEGAPVANARTGLLGAAVAAAPSTPVEEPTVAQAPVDEPTVAQTPVDEPTMAQAPTVEQAPIDEPIVAQAPTVEQAPIEEPIVAQAPTVVVGVEPSTYLVRPGDNLTHIARDHGSTIDAILAANGIGNANRVYAGLTLVIPGTAVVSDAVAEAEPEPAPVAQTQAPVAPAQPMTQPEADVPDAAEATTYV